MGFLSPWFLTGLLAAGLPIYVHLLRQHRSDPVKFSSLMFIEKRTQSSVKHRRLKYLALLAMRLAIILLLALMFANPFIKRSAAAAGGGRKLAVIAVDHSFSMRTGDRLARAKQQALDLIGTLRPGDRGQVMAFASNVQALTQPVTDFDELRRAVNSLQSGDGKSSYGEVARALRALGNPEGLPVETHIISDMQRTSMPTPFAELAIPAGMKLQLHSVASSRDPNWYVETINAPRSVFQAKQVRIRSTVAGSGTPKTDTSVELSLNGKVLETKKVALAEAGRTTVEFLLPDAAYGLNRGEVRITAGDSLPQDNTMRFSLERREASRILFVHDARNARSATYYKAAIESVPDAGYVVDSIASEQAGNVSPDKYALVVLSDTGALPKSLEDAVAAYVKKGGGVLISLGSSVAARGRVPVAGLEIDKTRYASREGERFLTAAEVDSSHAAVGRANSFEAVRFYQTVDFKPGKARILGKVAGGTPLIADMSLGEGRVLVFGSTLDNVANDLPLHASFIPFIEQSAHYLSGAESAPALYVVDSFAELRSARDSGTGVDVIDPDGKRAMSLQEAAKAQTIRLTREGFYELRRANGRNELIAVHADRRESDLDLIPEETLALWKGTGATGTTEATSGSEQAEKPWSLWWYIALALVLASIAESLFASRYIATEQEPLVVRKKAA